MRKNERQVGGGGEQGGGNSILKAAGVVLPWRVVIIWRLLHAAVFTPLRHCSQSDSSQRHDAVSLCSIHAACWSSSPPPHALGPLQDKLRLPHTPSSAPSQLLQTPSIADSYRTVPSVLKKAPFQCLKYSFLTNKMFIF